MISSGFLHKMAVYQDKPVKYYLNTEEDLFFLNELMGRKFKITYLGDIKCFCGKLVNNVFRMNFCYNCYYTLPEASEAILKPELSKAHLGIEERDLEFEKAYQLQPHTVYLAISGGLKVGVTRTSQQITRWIDQGAIKALPILHTSNRYEAGVWEVELKKIFSDKTAWREMLRWNDPDVDLLAEKNKILETFRNRQNEFLDHSELFTFEYPSLEKPDKITTINIETKKSVEGILTGIRGQYLILDNNKVFNIRTYEGRHVEIEIT